MAEQRAIVSLGELAELPGMPSETTIRRLMRRFQDFPVESQGQHGVAYEFDVLAVQSWLRERAAGLQAAEAERRAEFGQLALELLGDDAAAAGALDGATSPVERRQQLEAELLANKVTERRAQLIRRESVAQAIDAMLSADCPIRTTFRVRLSERCAVSHDVGRAIDDLLEKDRRDFAADLWAILNGGGNG